MLCKPANAPVNNYIETCGLALKSNSTAGCFNFSNCFTCENLTDESMNMHSTMIVS